MDEQVINSEAGPAPEPARSSGCLRTGLILLLVTIGVIFAVIAGLAVASYYTVDRAIVGPVQELVKSLGIDATPEIRPNPITVVRSINNLAQLQTASYAVEKIVTAEKGSNEFFGLFEDSLIFVAVGEVTAGIDLAKLSVNDIRVDTFDGATIRLPDPEVFVVKLDNEKSYVADRDTGLLTRADPQMETQVRQVAEEQILAGALDQGILDIAEENAQTVLEGLLFSLGFQTVTFVKGELPPPIDYDPEIPKGFILTPMAP